MTELRLVHTSDIHLDAAFGLRAYAREYSRVSFGARRRQALRDALLAVIRFAQEWDAHALLIAGDLFEAERISRDTLDFLRQTFAQAAPLPIIIAPGNHDPYIPGSPYAENFFPFPHVHIFSEAAWQCHRLESVPLAVHGFAFDGPDISTNPFTRMESMPNDGYAHVVLAHGSMTSRVPEGKSVFAPFDAEQMVDPTVAYVALGHYHNLIQYTNASGIPFCYPGSPEGLNFTEPGPRYCMAVTLTLESGRWRARLEPKKVNQAVYITHEIDCTAFSSAQELVEALRTLARRETCPAIARVKLTGNCSANFRAAINEVTAALHDDFLYLELRDETTPAEDYEQLAQASTSLGLLLRKMNEAIQDAPDAREYRKIVRAREIALAAFRGTVLPIPGVEEEYR